MRYIARLSIKLMDSGKIAADREGHIAWIWNPELVRKYLVKKHLMWRPE